MARTLTDRAWRSSAADRIEADLALLWQELARETPISRAVMSNLVVFCRCPAGADLDLASLPEGLPIEDVARHHPSRVILLHHDPDTPRENVDNVEHRAPAALAARVGVLTFGPSNARYGVELIVIRSACGERALPSIVRAFMLGDVPTSVWWTEDFSGTRPLVPLVTMGRQLLYDSRRWRDIRTAVLALGPLVADRFGPDLADVNWRRLTAPRQALVHAIGSSQSSTRKLTPIHIRHQRDEAALAWLFAGWLQDPTITVEEDSRLDEDILTVSFAGELTLRLGAHRVTVGDALGPAPFTIAVPRESEAEAVAAELRVLTHDAPFHDALGALVRRFGAS
jgi:hypothetical protein